MRPVLVNGTALFIFAQIGKSQNCFPAAPRCKNIPPGFRRRSSSELWLPTLCTILPTTLNISRFHGIVWQLFIDSFSLAEPRDYSIVRILSTLVNLINPKSEIHNIWYDMEWYCHRENSLWSFRNFYSLDGGQLKSTCKEIEMKNEWLQK